MPNIRISEETYKDLVKRGTLSDTFDKVIQRLLQQEKQTEVVLAK
jgi:predicted CopG family antitoxin